MAAINNWFLCNPDGYPGNICLVDFSPEEPNKQ
jgi:hypothetical protein